MKKKIITNDFTSPEEIKSKYAMKNLMKCVAVLYSDVCFIRFFILKF